MPRFILERVPGYGQAEYNIVDTFRGRYHSVGRINCDYVDLFETLFNAPNEEQIAERTHRLINDMDVAT